MMKKLSLIALVSLVAICGIVFWATNGDSVVGSGYETYSFTNITSTNASATSPVLIRGGAGTLGSVIVASSSGSFLRVYDGTATTSGTLIATFKASVGEQAFPLDVSVTKGIVLDVPATFNGSYTITYK